MHGVLYQLIFILILILIEPGRRDRAWYRSAGQGFAFPALPLAGPRRAARGTMAADADTAFAHSPHAMTHPCLSCGACCASFRVDFSVHESQAQGGRVPAGLAEEVTDHTCRMRGTDWARPAARPWSARWARRPIAASMNGAPRPAASSPPAAMPATACACAMACRRWTAACSSSLPGATSRHSTGSPASCPLNSCSEMRVHLAHAGQPVQAAEQQIGIGVEIARHDDQQEVLRPRDAMEHHDLGNGADRFLEMARGLLVLVVYAHHHEGQHAKTYGAPAQRGVVAGDHALVLQPLDAPP